MRIKHDGLREAYEGYYEEDMEVVRAYNVQCDYRINRNEDVSSYEEFLSEWCHRRCLGDTPLQRLEVYCHWNGLIGYADILYELATRGDVV